jgi:hypothetical protein
MAMWRSGPNIVTSCHQCEGAPMSPDAFGRRESRQVSTC